MSLDNGYRPDGILPYQMGWLPCCFIDVGMGLCCFSSSCRQHWNRKWGVLL